MTRRLLLILSTTVVSAALAVPVAAPARTHRAHAAASCTWSTWTIYARHGISCAGARKYLRLSYTSSAQQPIVCRKSPSGGKCGNIINARQNFSYRR